MLKHIEKILLNEGITTKELESVKNEIKVLIENKEVTSFTYSETLKAVIIWYKVDDRNKKTLPIYLKKKKKI